MSIEKWVIQGRFEFDPDCGVDGEAEFREHCKESDAIGQVELIEVMTEGQHAKRKAALEALKPYLTDRSNYFGIYDDAVTSFCNSLGWEREGGY